MATDLERKRHIAIIAKSLLAGMRQRDLAHFAGRPPTWPTHAAMQPSDADQQRIDELMKHTVTGRAALQRRKEAATTDQPRDQFGRFR